MSGTRKLAFFSLLLRKPRGLSFDEAHEKLAGATYSDDKVNKNPYYETCRGIQATFQKLGITDFLEYNFNQVKINPKYKREK